MKALILILTVFFAFSSFAANGKSVSYKSGDETAQGMLYTPQGKGPFRAIVVIHEWWGLNDWVKDQASKLADEGYVALAIDLYRGKVATTPEMAHEIMLLGFLGGQDRGITPDDVHKFETSMKQLGKKIDVTIYPDAGHAFENPNNKEGYRAADSADAWTRTTEFLASTLKK